MQQWIGLVMDYYGKIVLRLKWFLTLHAYTVAFRMDEYQLIAVD